jgi:hypothetical protein
MYESQEGHISSKKENSKILFLHKTKPQFVFSFNSFIIC